jgi:hypothetical protein
MTAPYTAEDALKFLIQRSRSVIESTTESIAWEQALNDDCPDFDAEREALTRHLDVIDDVAKQLLGDGAFYSDGRPVSTLVEIEHGVILDYLWSPDPSADVAHVITGRREAGPGTVRRGKYEITVTPPSSLTVRLFPPVTD